MPVKAVLQLRSGFRIPVWVSENETFSPKNMTADTVWRFPVRGWLQVGRSVIVSGAQIEFLIIGTAGWMECGGKSENHLP